MRPLLLSFYYLASWQAWFKALSKDEREKALNKWYTNPDRALPGHYKTKLCKRFPTGTCLRGAQCLMDIQC